MATNEPVTIKYHFKNIKNGQIAEGYTVLQIVNNEAEVSVADEQAMLLAEKHGGEMTTGRREKARAQDQKEVQVGEELK